MRETLSIIFLVLIVFFLLASILEVLFGLIAAALVIVWLVIIYFWPGNAIDNYMDLAVMGISYAILLTAILWSWVFRVRHVEVSDFADLIANKLHLDLLALTCLFIIGALIAMLYNLARQK
ncbi:MAG: hypothetical protein EX271_08740 [Acidimicrobiales bacterium]|nr:hypothetical protein [Hyphomonadaceae bacterium]RZV41095.1 MAG: hypothetical protein EX271_08740 [Acidimicrobiales bacterium]